MLRHIALIMLLAVYFVNSTSEEEAEYGLQESRASRKSVQSQKKVAVTNAKIDSSEKTQLAPEGKHKLKLKHKHKKFLKEFLTAGLLVKFAILPLALGFVKLLTFKALLITSMAFALVTTLTFSSAGEHKSSSTEVINLLPHGQSRSIRSVPEHIFNYPIFN